MRWAGGTSSWLRALKGQGLENPPPNSNNQLQTQSP